MAKFRWLLNWTMLPIIAILTLAGAWKPALAFAFVWACWTVVLRFVRGKLGLILIAVGIGMLVLAAARG